MRYYYLVLFILSNLTSYSQHEYMPLGAQWKYMHHGNGHGHKYSCDYDDCHTIKGKLLVVDTFYVGERLVSSIQRFTGIVGEDLYPLEGLLNLSEKNDSVFVYANNEFYLLYDFTAKDGDTIDIYIPSVKVGFGATGFPPFTEIKNDSIVHKKVIVYKQGEILINNEVRNVMRYKSIEENDLFEISSIINGIGSGYSILGSGVAHVGIDCYARVICYTDENQEYLFNNCCDYPNPYPERTFAPLGAEWLYEGYSDGGGYINDCENNCDGNYNLFRVTGEKEYAGKNYAIVERYHRTRDTEWENTGDEIMLYNYDGLFYSDNNWLDHIMTYSTNVSVGDTIRTGAVRDFPKWVGNDMYTYNLPGTSSLQVVTNIEEINIDGQLRKKITYHSLGEFRIGEVIEGIGPLYEGLLGNDIPIPTNGCLPRLLCYRDSLITFENEDCGCEFPIGPTSTLETQTTYFTLSPNPVTDQLYITISDFDIPEEITIFNISGSSQKVLPFHTSIDVSGLPRGMYLIQVGNAVKKFVKY